MFIIFFLHFLWFWFYNWFYCGLYIGLTSSFTSLVVVSMASYHVTHDIVVQVMNFDFVVCSSQANFIPDVIVTPRFWANYNITNYVLKYLLASLVVRILLITNIVIVVVLGLANGELASNLLHYACILTNSSLNELEDCLLVL